LDFFKPFGKVSGFDFYYLNWLSNQNFRYTSVQRSYLRAI
jgi:hypothetical protein